MIVRKQMNHVTGPGSGILFKFHVNFLLSGISHINIYPIPPQDITKECQPDPLQGGSLPPNFHFYWILGPELGQANKRRKSALRALQEGDFYYALMVKSR